MGNVKHSISVDVARDGVWSRMDEGDSGGWAYTRIYRQIVSLSKS